MPPGRPFAISSAAELPGATIGSSVVKLIGLVMSTMILPASWSPYCWTIGATAVSEHRQHDDLALQYALIGGRDCRAASCRFLELRRQSLRLARLATDQTDAVAAGRSRVPMPRAMLPVPMIVMFMGYLPLFAKYLPGCRAVGRYSIGSISTDPRFRDTASLVNILVDSSHTVAAMC